MSSIFALCRQIFMAARAAERRPAVAGAATAARTPGNSYQIWSWVGRVMPNRYVFPFLPEVALTGDCMGNSVQKFSINL